MQYCGKLLWYRVEYTPSMKIERHGQAKILTQQEIELLFNKGLQTARDRTSSEFVSTPPAALPKLVP
jgi:integrase/recombinase XerD